MTPSRAGSYSEDALVEQPAIALLDTLAWETQNAYTEFEHGAGSSLGRETKADVVLMSRLRPALERLNPGLRSEAIDQAIEELTRDRSRMSLAAANREVYGFLKNGVRVRVPDPLGEEKVELVRAIDWDVPGNNNFLFCSQFWVTGEMYTRRADLVGFVNGLPLVFMELKAAHRRLETAFSGNLTDYKDTIPHLFWYNALIILSNGSESRVGSVTAGWEHFVEWKKVRSEAEEGRVSLETLIRGTCEQPRLLDLAENFTLFEESYGGLIKILAKSHQYLGVNLTIEAVLHLRENKGRLGVFWHTQGSGKSISMIFFAQKILRKLAGNWTFVIVTDRQELDDQIYKNFVRCGAVTEKQAQASSGEDLRRLLTEDHRYVFTLIQKFHTERGETHPKLSERSDIIVITDEAHRSQYDLFALNMRSALPNAAFIGFTGTPLMAGEEKTREVFGDYVSVYNFRQSIDDGATVPLFYENRVPELQITNPDLNEDMQRLLEEAELDDDQEKKLEREFAREYHLITRDDRLETVAKDIVTHFIGRGQTGKAMVVCIDKATTVRMYDKVQKYWKEELQSLHGKLGSVPAEEHELLERKVSYMAGTDMAVVVSQSQNEVVEMKSRGLDVVPHRKRMVSQDLDTKFKDPDDPLRIVFVCAMWMTGFDVPCCSTIYLDKPMRNHTLMQTIARANRVFEEKVNGLIVDYVNVFRNLRKALAIYAAPGAGGGDAPIKSKEELVGHLRQAISQALAFCNEKGVDTVAIRSASGFDRVRLLDDAVEAIVVNDEAKQKYLSLVGNVVRLYKAILPDSLAREFASLAVLLAVIAEKIRALAPQADITEVMRGVEQLLDVSIAAEGYVISADAKDRIVDLSKIDFAKLRAKFAKARQRSEVEKLRGLISRKLGAMVMFNRTRMDYMEQFQGMVDEYNAGSMNIQQFFDELVVFAQKLNEEEKRAIVEALSEEELALFDLLTRPLPKLTKQQEIDVKRVVRRMLDALKREKLVIDWRKRQQSRQAVRLHIEQELDTLPEVYTPELYQEKCDIVYQHVYDSYFGEGKSIYASAA